MYPYDNIPNIYGMNNFQTNPYATQQKPFQSRQEIVRVNGRNGADAYQMVPNSSVLLLDDTAPIVWLKQSDGANYSTVTGYQISKIDDVKQQDNTAILQNFDERLKRLEEMYSNESNTDNAKRTKSEK